MLNEFKEFEAYVTNPTSASPRVQPKCFTERFNDECNLIGLEQIMTVIARAYIFSQENMKYGDVISEAIIEDTIELLHRWTGFSYNNDKNSQDKRKRKENLELDQWMQQHSVEDSWLKNYWMFQFDNVKVQKKSNRNKEELWTALETKWNKRLESSLDYMVEKFNYRNIIANALELGPLKNRYLVVKKERDQKDQLKENKRFKYLFDESSRQVTSDMKIMKLVAIVLLKRENCPPGQKEVWIRNSELANWFGMDDSNNGNNTWYQQDACKNGIPIYSRRKLSRNTTKVSIDEEYLKNNDIHLIDLNDVEKYRETHWILEDNGHGLKDCWNIK